MEKFVTRHAGLVTSILSGLDRLVFRGHLTPLMCVYGMFYFLKAAKVRRMRSAHAWLRGRDADEWDVCDRSDACDGSDASASAKATA